MDQPFRPQSVEYGVDRRVERQISGRGAARNKEKYRQNCQDKKERDDGKINPAPSPGYVYHAGIHEA
jgi:hypothetical protein